MEAVNFEHFFGNYFGGPEERGGKGTSGGDPSGLGHTEEEKLIERGGQLEGGESKKRGRSLLRMGTPLRAFSLRGKLWEKILSGGT